MMINYEYIQINEPNASYTTTNSIIQASIQAQPGTTVLLDEVSAIVGEVGVLEYDNIAIKTIKVNTNNEVILDLLISNENNEQEVVENGNNIGNINLDYDNNKDSVMLHKEDE